MEEVFTRLVDQFINGKLSRRGLIQNLAAASAVAATSGRAFAAAGRRELKAMAVNHISYQCKDYGRLRDFYAQNFGMKVTHDSGKQCYLGFGDTMLIVRNSTGQTPLIDHVALTIKGYGPKGGDPAKFKADNDSVKAELEARGFTPEPETELSWAVKDPEGFKIQVAPEIMTPGDPMFERVVSGFGKPPAPK